MLYIGCSEEQFAKMVNLRWSQYSEGLQRIEVIQIAHRTADCKRINNAYPEWSKDEHNDYPLYVNKGARHPEKKPVKD